MAPPQKELFTWMKDIQANIEAKEKLTKAMEKTNVIDEALPPVVPAPVEEIKNVVKIEEAKSEIFPQVAQAPPMAGADGSSNFPLAMNEPAEADKGLELAKPQEDAYGLATSNSEVMMPNSAPAPAPENKVPEGEKKEPEKKEPEKKDP